jgi:hypothetical protein
VKELLLRASELTEVTDLDSSLADSSQATMAFTEVFPPLLFFFGGVASESPCPREGDFRRLRLAEKLLGIPLHSLFRLMMLWSELELLRLVVMDWLSWSLAIMRSEKGGGMMTMR